MPRVLLLPNLDSHVDNFPHEVVGEGDGMMLYQVTTVNTILRVGLQLPEGERFEPTQRWQVAMQLINASTDEEITPEILNCGTNRPMYVNLKGCTTPGKTQLLFDAKRPPSGKEQDGGGARRPSRPPPPRSARALSPLPRV